jgi:hypothetical protein
MLLMDNAESPKPRPATATEYSRQQWGHRRSLSPDIDLAKCAPLLLSLTHHSLSHFAFPSKSISLRIHFSQNA